ncbi:MAG: hypothetical protein LUE87_04385 [Lachnospiraceae bacterium]|nr:hypothetical protein [Lachnospiraceae bacterium]
MQEQMEQIDVEAIMQDIRKKIEEKGYRKSDLHFADITGPGEACPENFTAETFSSMVDFMNARSQVNCDGVLQGNKIAVLIKKVIRKIIRFYIWPIVNDQNFFNSCATSAMTQLRLKLEEEQIRNEELTSRLEELEKRLEQMEGNRPGQLQENQTGQREEERGGRR